MLEEAIDYIDDAIDSIGEAVDDLEEEADLFTQRDLREGDSVFIDENNTLRKAVASSTKSE